ncbi:MAG: SpoIIE family protein phosphatase [Pseudomonadota bacterium]
MKQSIIFKTLLILGSVVIIIFIASGYLFSKNDNELIAKIRDYNLNSAMTALDYRQALSLKNNQQQMQDATSMIAKNSSSFLLNFDTDGLKESLLFDIKRSGVKAIRVWDSSMNEVFLLAFKEDNNIVFKKSLPEFFNQYTQFKRPINQINSNKVNTIGEITLYYDESIIIDLINKLKKQTKEEISNFNHAIDKELLQSNIIKLYIAIGFLITILLVSTLLLIIFVNTPLKLLKTGLDDFFLFLQHKKNSTEKIILNSNDEFGQMAKSLNENISVSAKLHEDIRELNSNLEQKVAHRTEELAQINQEVQDSIDYAATIQRSFLKDPAIIHKRFNDSFIIWQPRDKVGGDLYIYEEKANNILFGVVDCTGHSVPGGFMTMLAGSVIKKLSNEFFDNPAKLLGELNIAIKHQLNQDSKNSLSATYSLSDDGLDIGLCFIDKEHKLLRFAGAKIDLVYFKSDELDNIELNIVKSNKQSIGYKKSKIDYEYTNHEIHVDSSESFYLYSDGLTDQAGGQKNYPYGNKKFKNLLTSIQGNSMTEQASIILHTLTQYQGINSKRDDITVIGFKI